MIEEAQTLIGKLNCDTLEGQLNIGVEYVEPTTQEKTITPTKQIQNVMPDENYYALSKVVVNPIPNEYIIPNYQEKTITPTSQTQNVTPDSNYDALSKVVVNGVSGLLDWSAIGYSGTPQKIIDDYNYSKNIYDNWDSTVTNYTNKFSSNVALVMMPSVDTSNGLYFERMFYSCYKLTIVPQLNTTKGVSFDNMFYSCVSLLSLPQLDTSNGTSFMYMFYGCNSLVSLPQLDMSKAYRINAMFSGCTELTNFGGLKNLGQAYSTSQPSNYYLYELYLPSCTKLTHDSLMNVINNLYDIASKGCQPQKLVLGSTNLAKLTAEEIAIATNKGWNVS